MGKETHLKSLTSNPRVDKNFSSRTRCNRLKCTSRSLRQVCVCVYACLCGCVCVCESIFIRVYVSGCEWMCGLNASKWLKSIFLQLFWLRYSVSACFNVRVHQGQVECVCRNDFKYIAHGIITLFSWTNFHNGFSPLPWIHCAPSSTQSPLTGMVWIRPPTRSRASRMTTSQIPT